MPSIPPFSRYERVESYAKYCSPVTWEEHSISSIDGTRITLVTGKRLGSPVAGAENVVIVYFQGRVQFQSVKSYEL